MACRDGKGKASGGMVLPFDPMTMTFKDLHYYVPIPKVPPLISHSRPAGLQWQQQWQLLLHGRLHCTHPCQ